MKGHAGAASGKEGGRTRSRVGVCGRWWKGGCADLVNPNVGGRSASGGGGGKEVHHGAWEGQTGGGFS